MAGDDKRVRVAEAVAAGLGLAVLGWLGWFYFGFLGSRPNEGVEVYALLGDAAGPFTGVLSALALFAALYSVSLQRRELAFQRQELALQRAEFKASREAMEKQAKAAEESVTAQLGLAAAQARLARSQDTANGWQEIQTYQTAVMELDRTRARLGRLLIEEHGFHAPNPHIAAEHKKAIARQREHLEEIIRRLETLVKGWVGRNKPSDLAGKTD